MRFFRENAVMKNGVGKNAVSGKAATLFVVVFGMCLNVGAFSAQSGVRREAVSEMERTQFRGLHAGVVRPVEHVRCFLWIEAENFASYGDWEVDSQFTHKMGSSYLICPGLDTPRTNAARTTVAIPRAGTWHVWVRTKDWIPEHSPGKFALELSGHRSKVLGASGLAGCDKELLETRLRL